MSNAHKDRYQKGFQGYETPPALINAVLEGLEIDEFDIDVCCSRENIPARRRFKPHGAYEYHDNGRVRKINNKDALNQNWHGLCWMNPPYGADLKRFVEKAHQEWEEDRASTVALLPIRFENKYYHELILSSCDVIYILSGKIRFNIDGEPASGFCPVPSMLALWLLESQEVAKWPLFNSLCLAGFRSTPVAMI